MCCVRKASSRGQKQLHRADSDAEICPNEHDYETLALSILNPQEEMISVSVSACQTVFAGKPQPRK